MIGGKTGSSEKSLFNQCTCVKWNNSRLTYITLGSDSMLKRKEDVERLVTYTQGMLKLHNIEL